MEGRSFHRSSTSPNVAAIRKGQKLPFTTALQANVSQRAAKLCWLQAPLTLQGQRAWWNALKQTGRADLSHHAGVLADWTWLLVILA